MHRCYLEPDQWGDSVLRLTPEESHHLLHVLRARVGDPVEVLDGVGRLGQATLRAGGRSAELLLESEQTASLPRWQTTLFQCVIKGQRMDHLIEKASELGAARVQPVVSKRCVVKIADGDQDSRRERWQRIAVGAAKQCGNRFLSHVSAVVRFDEMLKMLSGFDVLVVGALQGDVVEFCDLLGRAREKGGGRAGVVIGPEGDLTPDELERVIGAGAAPVGFGPQVLRAETAAVYALSVMSYELGRDQGPVLE